MVRVSMKNAVTLNHWSESRRSLFHQHRICFGEKCVLCFAVVLMVFLFVQF